MAQKFFRFVLRLFGWELVGQRPDAKKYLAICAPHTSNWDAFWFFIAVRALGVQPKVLIKSAYYRFPFKRLFLALGGVPVDRGFKAKDLAQQMIEYVASVDEVALMIAPEGSRSKQKYWKVGFYQIAQAADLPVYFGFCDYAAGQLGIDETPLHVTGDPAADMDVVRAFYTGIAGKWAGRIGPIRLKRE